ncbi:MAG: DUF1659 domain-containing protein [Syntrophomonadaceae bacterium]
MAVTATTTESQLVLVMDNGTGALGQTLTKRRIYKDIKTSASNEDLYSIAQDLATLQSRNNLAVQRYDIIELEQS